MRMAALAVVMGVGVGAVAQERRTWEFNGGSWSEAPAAPTTQPAVVEPIIDRAEQLLFQGEYDAARKMLFAWELDHKKSPARDRCIFLLADCFYQGDDRIKAFYYCDELMDEYPESSLFQAALLKQYQIADAYLGTYRDSFLFMRILDESDIAIDMMFRIQQRAPGSPLAEKALLRTADYYFSDQDYDLAFDAYNAYERAYPRSDEIPRVKLRAAFSSLAQFRGVNFDATNLIDARAQLVDIRKNYPQLAADENVDTVIEQIDSAFAKKILIDGEFYERVHQPAGAVYQYRFLAQVYPASPEAAVAKARLARMPASALSGPIPPPASGYAPTTQPSNNNESLSAAQ
jgi:outer membrane protein assembly factor BamD (BamD/ComL family)